MLRLSIVFGLLASVAVWRTTPTACRQAPNQTQDANQQAAAAIERSLDASVRPCDNFYRFACGRWAEQHIEQLDYGDVLGLMDHELNKKLEHLLRKPPAAAATTDPPTEPPSEPPTDPRPPPSTPEERLLEKMRSYYRSCRKLKPHNLKRYLQLIQPGRDAQWFLLARQGGRRWRPDRFHWLAAVAKLRLYGLNGALLREEVLPRWDDAAAVSIYLDKPNVAETAPAGEPLLTELLLDIGQTRRAAADTARAVHAFELQLHQLQQLDDDEGPKEMQLGYLQQYMPLLDWLALLRELKGPHTDLATTVIIQNVPYMRALARLAERVPPATLCNYLMLRFLLFLKARGPSRVTRHECVASLRRAMPLALSHLVGGRLYRGAAANDAQVARVFGRLKRRLHETVAGNRLQLAAPILATQLQKVDSVEVRVGFAPRNLSAAYVEDYYARAALDPHNFYANQLSLLRLAVERSHENLEPLAGGAAGGGQLGVEAILGADWDGSSSAPLYVKARNLVLVPYGLLQPPLYQRGLGDVLQFSALGFALAHELMHGFDSAGIDYDSAGNIMGPSEEIGASARFMQGLRCMQNELAAGAGGLNEKLADYEGLRLAYAAHFGAAGGRKQPPADLLPRFTEQQLFFLNFAQSFCAKPPPPGAPSSASASASAEHGRDELRVLQALANFEEFASAFHCERRDKMHSRHRCRLW